MKGKDFKKEVYRLLHYGIEQYGTRYECQKKLVWYYWSLNFSRDECYEAIRKWYYAHDHRSKGWESKPERVLRNLLSSINSLYRNAELKGYKPGSKREKRLRIGDVQKIVALTSDYRLQKFIFDLLLFAIKNKDSSNEFRLPWVVITAFQCCSRESYQDKMRFCEEVGLIIKTKQFCKEEHKARTYMINFGFSEAGDYITSLEDGLRKLFPQAELRSRYTRWVYDKFLRC